jgi:GntR family transcriptional regulator
MSDRRPAYQRVADELRSAIADGRYPSGSHLPSESELVERHGVSRGTIRQTYAQLQHEGIISSQRGSRRVVVDGPHLQSFEGFVGFSTWVRSLGKQPSGRVIQLVRREADPDEQAALGLAPGAVVFHLLRLRLISSSPAMVERTAYPEDLGRIVATMDLEHESITEHLSGVGHAFAHAEHTIDAVRATAEDARLLKIHPRSPILRARRLTTDPNGRPIEWSDDRYRADSVAFTLRNSATPALLDRVEVGRAHQPKPRRVGSRTR